MRWVYGSVDPSERRRWIGYHRATGLRVFLSRQPRGVSAGRLGHGREWALSVSGRWCARVRAVPGGWGQARRELCGCAAGGGTSPTPPPTARSPQPEHPPPSGGWFWFGPRGGGGAVCIRNESRGGARGENDGSLLADSVRLFLREGRQADHSGLVGHRFDADRGGCGVEFPVSGGVVVGRLGGQAWGRFIWRWL